MTGHNASGCVHMENPDQGYENVNYMGSYGNKQQGRYDPFSNTYNPGWRDHPNFSWKNPGAAQPSGPPGFQNSPQPQYQQRAQPSPPPQPPTQDRKLEGMLMQFMSKMDQESQVQKASIRNLELQVGQLAKMMEERRAGQLPSNTEVNPRETAMAIGHTSNKIIESALVEEEEEVNEFNTFDLTNMSTSVQETEPRQDTVADGMISSLSSRNAQPERPKCTKPSREIRSGKAKLEEYITMPLSAECSAILQRAPPPKLKDPGSFTVPCYIRDFHITKALCDLGASTNLMPLSLYRKLGINGLKPTTVTLQLADGSIRYPRGVVEDLLVTIGKFVFPVDFLVLEMEYDADIPPIFGRPFLATAGAIIDVKQGKIILNIGEETVEFTIFKTSEDAVSTLSCHRIDGLRGDSSGDKTRISQPKAEASLGIKPPDEVMASARGSKSALHPWSSMENRCMRSKAAASLGIKPPDEAMTSSRRLHRALHPWRRLADRSMRPEAEASLGIKPPD